LTAATRVSVRSPRVSVKSPIVPDKKATTWDRHWDAGYLSAMHAVMEHLLDTLAAGHDTDYALHAVMHLAASRDMLDRLDDTGDLEEVVSTGWGKT
jgi:hypothetical protein